MNKYILSKKIYLFRHGETDWNIQHKRQGCENDIELNANGKKQSESVANYLLNINVHPDLIISSGMARADETARIIGEKLNYKSSILIIDNLKEKCHGKLSGITDDDLKSNPIFKEFDELMIKFKKEKDPIKQRMILYDNNIICNKLYNEELFNVVRHRVKKALREIYNQKEKTIIVVSHSGIIQEILKILTNTTDHIKGEFPYGTNCTMSYIQVFEKVSNNKIKRKIKIIKLLTTAHLYNN
jgi:broad specificity phosphatase PhoE